eukprot:m.118160 g.118160  ORF g.118160 m.118160 type:complete len:321 (-) comp9529_c0_seq1:5776-6738(-)
MRAFASSASSQGARLMRTAARHTTPASGHKLLFLHFLHFLHFGLDGDSVEVFSSSAPSFFLLSLLRFRAFRVRSANLPHHAGCVLVLPTSLAHVVAPFLCSSGCSAVELIGHTGPIVDLAFNLSGTRLLSTADDCSLRLWDAETDTLLASLTLDSTPARCMWNPAISAEGSGTNELMVAEHSGILRFLHAEKDTFAPLFSLQTNGTPLVDADWSAVDPEAVAAIGNGAWMRWHKSSSSLPSAVGQVHSHLGGKLRWSRFSDNIFLLSNLHSVELFAIRSDGSTTSLISVDGCASAVAWHPAAPVCIVAMGSTLVALNSEL